MFVNMKTGVMTLMLTFAAIPVIIARCNSRGIDLSCCKNIMLYLFLFISIYYFVEIVNPNNVMSAWTITMAHYFVYPVAMAIIVPIAIRDIKGVETLLIIWSVFILAATMKGYWQKSHGFNAKEMYFLYTLGGWRTHIIWSGIRYFSFFSDAANYGVHAALGATALAISAVHASSKKLRIIFIVASLCGFYSMAISGTRAAMVIPLVALMGYVVLSKNVKGIIGGSVFFIAIFSFFYFTNIGNGNQYIRKMRSAFHPDHDASYQLRVENRNKMKELMAVHPIGYGIGLSKGERYSPRDLMPYPPDSWLVSVWVETGLIGLVLYLIVHGVLFAWCAWTILFKIMNKRLRGLLSAWICIAAGFFVSAYANDVMQYPNSIPIYTAFALCIAGPYIDKNIMMQENGVEDIKPKKHYRYYKDI